MGIYPINDTKGVLFSVCGCKNSINLDILDHICIQYKDILLQKSLHDGDYKQ